MAIPPPVLRSMTLRETVACLNRLVPDDQDPPSEADRLMAQHPRARR